MGTLLYGPGESFPFDDRALAHLRNVIVNKLVRQESFLFTWNDHQTQRSIWLHPASSLEFSFESVEVQMINRAWIEELTALANGPAGLHLTPEPEVSDDSES